jgi:hypothetical protein
VFLLLSVLVIEYCRKADDEWVNERKKMFQELEKMRAPVPVTDPR